MLFNIGDTVTFGVRFGNGIRKGGIARKQGTVIDITDKFIVVKSESKLHNLRELRGGYVVETERDDPRGRLYLDKVELCKEFA